MGCESKILELFMASCYTNVCWGTSSFGRALPWHGRGEEFESPVLHHFEFHCTYRYLVSVFFCLFKPVEEAAKVSASSTCVVKVVFDCLCLRH